MEIDFTKAEVDVLIDLIRGDNLNQILTSSQIRFHTPIVFTPIPQVPKNTLIIGEAVDGGMYTGSQAFYYDRVPINQFVHVGMTDISFVQQGEVNVADLIPRINARLGINLAYDSVINDELPVLDPFTKPTANFMLRIAPGSLVYRGQVALKLKLN